jgi:hypothetical protein
VRPVVVGVRPVGERGEADRGESGCFAALASA